MVSGLLRAVPLVVAFILIADADAARRRPGGPVCGDAILDEGEQCDDGNADEGDGCLSTCEVAAPSNCTEIHFDDYDRLYGFDPYFYAMVKRADELKNAEQIVEDENDEPIAWRCLDGDGDEFYATLIYRASDPQEYFIIRSHPQAEPYLSTVLYEILPDTSQVKLHFYAGSLVYTAPSEGGSASLELFDLDGNPVPPSGSPLVAAGSFPTCADQLSSHRMCVSDAVSSSPLPIMACMIKFLGSVGVCAGGVAFFGATAPPLAIALCGVALTSIVEAAAYDMGDQGVCKEAFDRFFAANCPTVQGSACDEPPGNCASQKQCKFVRINLSQFRPECQCPLEIVSISSPLIAINEAGGGPESNAADPEITWDGSPDFPVAVSHKTPMCPGAWSCPPWSQTFEGGNPLVWTDALGCTAFGAPLPQSFDTEFAIIDSQGLMSDPYTATWTCVND